MKQLIEHINLNKKKLLEKHAAAKGAVVVDHNDVEDFLKAFDDYWLDTVDKSRFIEADGFHPSSLGTAFGKCARYHVYMLRGVEKNNTFDARVLRVLDTGNKVHEKLQASFDNMGVLVSAEIPIDHEDPPVKGHADGVIKWKDRVILIEIKSIGRDGFDMRLKYKKPKPEHLDQAFIYAHILGIDVIWVIYYCKNDESLAIFEVPTDHEAAKKQIDKWGDIYKVFLDGDLPKRKYKPDSPTCAQCPLKAKCWSDPEESV